MCLAFLGINKAFEKTSAPDSCRGHFGRNAPQVVPSRLLAHRSSAERNVQSTEARKPARITVACGRESIRGVAGEEMAVGGGTGSSRSAACCGAVMLAAVLLFLAPATTGSASSPLLSHPSSSPLASRRAELVRRVATISAEYHRDGADARSCWYLRADQWHCRLAGRVGVGGF